MNSKNMIFKANRFPPQSYNNDFLGSLILLSIAQYPDCVISSKTEAGQIIPQPLQ